MWRLIDIMGCCCATPKPKEAHREKPTDKGKQLDQMSIFNTPTMIEKRQATEAKPPSKKQVCYTFSDASSAIREKYRATNTMLGEGAFG